MTSVTNCRFSAGAAAQNQEGVYGMAGATRIFKGPGCRLGNPRRALLIILLATFAGVAADPPRAAGQSIGDYPGSPTQTQPPQTSPTPQRNRLPSATPPDVFPKAGEKRKKAILDDNFKKLKEHAQDLAELAKSLQAEIEKSNENVLSLEILKKADEAEKLARKIKSEAKGF